jgi:predicted esterase
MWHGCSRRRGARAKVCLLLAALGLLFTRAAWAAEPLVLFESDDEPGVVVYPAVSPGVHGVTVLLHGMCGEPVNACRHFAGQVTVEQHLICPRASRRCEGGGSTWPQTGFDRQIERAVQRAETALGQTVDETHGRTLIGYSLGAFRALELAQHGGGKYPRVMLIGAKIFPNRKLLRESGVQRLLMSAGTWDMMHDHMRRETERLARSGFTTRFLALGPVGHAFTPSFALYLPEALRWLGEAAPPAAVVGS